MRIETLCTGDELLTGLTTDTNSTFFQDKLFRELGQKLEWGQTVGDVRDDIIAALRIVTSRADAVLVSGGLGPTSDDLTAECAAAAAGVPLVENKNVLTWLEERFAQRGLVVTPNNARQALVPQGAEVVRNAKGSAPMFIQRLGRCTLFFVPGVPGEYRHLVEHEVLPRLRKQLEQERGRIFRAFLLMKTVGLPESHLDAAVAPLAVKHRQVVFGFRTHAPENHLKLMAEASSQEGADAALAAAAAECRPLLSRWLFAEGEQTLAGKVGALLLERKQTLALAESCTGGGVAAQLTDVPGASGFLIGSAVVYREVMKQRWATVSAESLNRFGAVSAEVATEMAQGIRGQCEASWGLSVTGFAGPDGGTPADPVGTVYCGLASEAGVEIERQVFVGDRARVRAFAGHLALDFLRRRLIKIP